MWSTKMQGRSLISEALPGDVVQSSSTYDADTSFNGLAGVDDERKFRGVLRRDGGRDRKGRLWIGKNAIS